MPPSTRSFRTRTGSLSGFAARSLSRLRAPFRTAHSGGAVSGGLGRGRTRDEPDGPLRGCRLCATVDAKGRTDLPLAVGLIEQRSGTPCATRLCAATRAMLARPREVLLGTPGSL